MTNHIEAPTIAPADAATGGAGYVAFSRSATGNVYEIDSASPSTVIKDQATVKADLSAAGVTVSGNTLTGSN